MRRTLLLIPHEIAGIPVFGVGWLLILLVAAFVGRLWVARRRGQPIGQLLAGEAVMWALAAAAVTFLLPHVELTNLDGQPVGMAIRGYGVMLLGGVVAAVALAAYRASRYGIDPEVIFAIAPWAFFGGIVGARLFFVIQYRDQFIAESWVQTLANVLKFTEGGLVVYGSFIGGFLAAAYFVLRHRLPLLKLGDVIVPCLFLGVFFGRVGCLFNGCCYGGQCQDAWYALHFPPNSPVYQDQLRSGELIGLRFDPASRRITEVRPGSLAASAGIEVGSTLEEYGDDLTPLEVASREIPSEQARTGVIATVDGKRHRWSPSELPTTARPVIAAQWISSISSLGLCLALCGLSAFALRDGTVMLLGFASYAVLRFVLELVRVDEAGQFGTDLSISQWVSLIVFGLSLAGLAWIHLAPPGEALQARPSGGNE